MSPRLTENTVLVVSQEQVSADVSPDLEGDVVVLDLKDGVYYELNETSARAWDLMKQPRSMREIRETIVAEYDVDPVRCEADLRGLLQEMLERGLVEVKDEPDS